MSSLAASPGKENSMGNEKDLEMKDLNNLLSDAKEVSFRINNPGELTADKTDAADLSGFNVLGNHAAVVDKMVASLDSAVRLIRENETDMKEGRKGTIDVLSAAKDLSTGVETLCKAATVLISQLTDGSKVTACFEKLVPSLGQLVEVANAKQYKGLSSVILLTSLKLLKKMETSSSGPYESSLLSVSELFLSRCLNHTNFDLRRAVAAMWKTTFAESKELVYSEKMRSVLLVAAKRHSMFLPGLSVETIDEPKTPTSKAVNTVKIRSSKKRVAALLDEDSVDYVPIQQTPGSTKKMKLTEHQKEVFATRMDKIPMMDEDSRQPGSLPNKLAEQFDVETSMSASQSTKKSVEQPAVRRTSPRLEDQKKAEAAVETQPKADSPKEAAEKIEEEVQKETTPDDAVKKRKKSPKQKKEDGEEGSGGKKNASLKKKKTPEEKESETGSETSRDGLERRRGARRSLNMPSSSKNDAKKDKVTVKSEPMETEEPGSVTSSIESYSESSQDSSDAPSTRSRRSQAKGTPSKFVAKPRRSKAAETPDLKAGTPQKKKKRGRPPTKKAVVLEETDETVPTVAMNALASPVAVKKEEEKADEPMETEEAAKETEDVAEEVDPVASEIEAVAPVVEREKSPVRNDDKDETEQFCTPKKAEDIFHTPVSSIRMTPGILKKANTPSTLEKRHRVHFTNEAIMRKEERNGIVATPKRTPGVLDADDHRMNEAVFPLLAENKDPVAKVLVQLCPIATTNGVNFLRRAFEQNKILTIGDLARATGKDISALPVKNPRYDTVKNTLKDYADSIGVLGSSPQKTAQTVEKELEVIFERVNSPSPALQETRNIRSPVPAKLQELDLVGNPPPSPKVFDVEDMDTAEPEEVVPPVVASENTDFAKLFGTLKSLSSSATDLDLITDLTAEQAKQLLTSASEAMSLLAALQNKLITRIA